MLPIRMCMLIVENQSLAEPQRQANVIVFRCNFYLIIAKVINQIIIMICIKCPRSTEKTEAKLAFLVNKIK